LEACRRRAVLDFTGDGGAQGGLDADDVREACRQARDGGVDPFGIRIAYAMIRGRLDLRAFSVACPLQFLGCSFTDVVSVEGAVLKELVLAGHPVAGASGDQTDRQCELPGLMASGLRLDGDLVLSRMVITGAEPAAASTRRTAAVWLADAVLGGRIIAAGTRIETRGDRAIHADCMRVNGAVRLIHGFHATAEVRLLRARIGGAVDLSGATLTPHNGRALDLSESSAGSLFLLPDPVTGKRARIEGRVKLDHTRLNGRILIRGADLQAPHWDTGREYYDHARTPGVDSVLDGPGATVTGGLTLESDVHVAGAILLPESTLGGVTADGAELLSSDSIAVDLARSHILAGLTLRGATVAGMVDLTDAAVDGTLDLTGLMISRPPGRRCLRGVGLSVDGEVILRHAVIRGGMLGFRSATISGALDAEAATMINPGDLTLNLAHARIGGNVRLLHGFTSTGLLTLRRCDVAGRVACHGGTFRWVPADRPRPQRSLDRYPNDPPSNRHGSAVEIVSATIHNGIELGWSVPSGAVDLTDTHTSSLADDPATDWPPTVHLSGFSYQRFAARDNDTGEGVWSVRARIRWLQRAAPTDPRPWQQTATVLRANGDAAGADEVLISYRRLARRLQRKTVRRLLDWLYDATVRCGYRPQRALFVLLALIACLWAGLTPASVQHHLRASDAIGTVYQPSRTVITPGPGSPASAPCGDGRLRCFQPFFYAVDTVVPIIDLKQRSTWYPAPDDDGRLLDITLNTATVLGWLFSTVFVLALARLGRSD
jgi:hypothetical protein